MRLASALLIFVLVTGCRNLPPPEVIPPKPVVKPVRLQEPLDASLGRVLSVQTRLRFVVLDFSLSRLPALGESLDLWRNGQIVGLLRVSGPIRNSTVVADIVQGEPKAGDQVRHRPTSD